MGGEGSESGNSSEPEAHRLIRRTAFEIDPDTPRHCNRAAMHVTTRAFRGCKVSVVRLGVSLPCDSRHPCGAPCHHTRYSFPSAFASPPSRDDGAPSPSASRGDN